MRNLVRFMVLQGLGFVNNCVESVVFIGCVFYSPDGTVWFDEHVLSFYYVSISGFVLWFDITSMVVLDTIFELVFRGGLQIKHKLIIHFSVSILIRFNTNLFLAINHDRKSFIVSLGYKTFLTYHVYFHRSLKSQKTSTHNMHFLY